MFDWFFGDRLPGTNLHELNLGWIIGEVKRLGLDVEQFRQYYESIKDQIDTEVAEQIPEAIDEAITAGKFNSLINQSHARRFVFISDSYGEGYNPDGNVTGFPQRIKDAWSLSNDNCFIFNKGGAKFGAVEGNEYAFDTVLSNALASITDKDTITDIVFSGGYNDNSASTSDISNGIGRCRQIIQANFANPSLRVYIMAIGYNALDGSIRSNLYNKYTTAYARSGLGYCHLTEALCYRDLWGSDGYHPNADGQVVISNVIMSILKGGCSVPAYNVQEFAPVSNASTNANMLSEPTLTGIKQMLFISYFEFEEAITLDNTFRKISEFTSKLPIASSDSSQCIRKQLSTIIELSDESLVEAPVEFYVKLESGTTFGIYARVLKLNALGTGFESYSTVEKINMPVNAYETIIPYKF